MKLTFSPKEFEKLRSFQDRLAKEFGDTVYVGTNSACVHVDYSPQLVAMLRPFPPTNQYEYELSQLTCEVCKKKAMFLSVPGETTYVCNDCVSKRKSKS